MGFKQDEREGEYCVAGFSFPSAAVRENKKEVLFMKRILGMIALGGLISVFFTGCNSILVEKQEDPVSIVSSIAATESSGEGIRLNYDPEDANKTAPDYFEQNIRQKFDNLEGKAAFKIKDGHSTKTADLESFQIEDLMEDGTFYYAYITRTDGEGEERQKVHCAAAYNYRTEDFQVLHESYSSFDSLEEDQESFYIQVCKKADGDRDIFVYDNGIGILYDEDGQVRFKAEIESVLRACYNKANSLTITHAMSNGENRIYLELALEKEPLTLPENPEADKNPKGEGDADKEAEEVEKEIGDKVESLLFTYNFIPIHVSIEQDNVAHQKQKEEWIRMTEGKKYHETHPGAVADWNVAVKRFPVKWGGGRLAGYKNLDIYSWKQGIRFEDNSKTFKPVSDTYDNLTNIRLNREFAGTFVMDGDSWYSLGGKTGGEREFFDEEVISREYIYTYTTETTDSEGNPVQEIHEKTMTQKVRVATKLRTSVESAWLEYYGTDNIIHSLGGCVNGRMLACSDGEAYWLDDGGKTLEKDIEEGMTTGLLEDKNTIYLIQHNGEKMIIEPIKQQSHAGKRWEIFYNKLTSRYAQGNSPYDEAFEQLNEGRLWNADVYGNGDYFTEDNIRIVEMDGDKRREGILFTSQNKGIVFYDTISDEAILLAEGSWYRTWNTGDSYLSVGFAKNDTSYESMDVAFARVYEYDLESLFEEAAREVEESEAREDVSGEESTGSQTEDNKETSASQQLFRDPAKSGEGFLEDLDLKPMKDTWDEEYKDKRESADFREAEKEGETFDSKAYEESEKKRKEQEEESNEARIDSIVGGLLERESEE